METCFNKKDVFPTKLRGLLLGDIAEEIVCSCDLEYLNKLIQTHDEFIMLFLYFCII